MSWQSDLRRFSERRFHRLFAAGILLALAAAFLPVCRGEEAAESYSLDEPYLLQSGDELEIAVWSKPEWDLRVPIRETGSFFFPPVGEVQAADRSVSEVELELQRRIDEALAPEQQEQEEPELPSGLEPLTPAQAADQLYQLQPGDQLDITVWEHKDLNQKALIREDGSFSFPLIGNVVAAGRTIPDLEKEITDRLNRDFIVNPQVSLRLVGAQFSILGQKGESGSYPLDGTLKLLSAISTTGDIASLRTSPIEIIRNHRGKQYVIRTDVGRLLSGKDSNMPVLPRDTIHLKAPFIVETRQVYVRLVGAKFTALGEVEHPGSQPIDGPVDLLTAISLTGGVTKFGSPHVEIIRSRGSQKYVIRANLHRIIQGTEENVWVYPRDTLHVRRRLF